MLWALVDKVQATWSFQVTWQPLLTAPLCFPAASSLPCFCHLNACGCCSHSAQVDPRCHSPLPALSRLFLQKIHSLAAEGATVHENQRAIEKECWHGPSTTPAPLGNAMCHLIEHHSCCPTRPHCPPLHVCCSQMNIRAEKNEKG